MRGADSVIMCQNYESIWQASFLPLLRAEITYKRHTRDVRTLNVTCGHSPEFQLMKILEKYFPTPVVGGVCASTQRVT